MIEIEKRGYLTAEFKSWLENNAEVIDQYHQLNIFCENTADSAVVFGDKGYTMSIVLTRRQGEVKGEVKMKKGDMGAVSRREHKFDFDPNDVVSLLSILETLGIIGYCPRYYQRTDYEYDGLAISTKENGLLADHFEVELAVTNEDQIEAGEKKIDDFFQDRQLLVFAKDEYERVLREIFENNPPVGFDQIDMSKIMEIV